MSGIVGKSPIDLHAVVQTRLDQLTFLKPLRLTDVSEGECNALDEGTSASFTQGVRMNDSAAIFLNHWGWGRSHGRYSFTIFELANGRWQQVGSRIEDIKEAVALAITALAEQPPTTVEAVDRSEMPSDEPSPNFTLQANDGAVTVRALIELLQKLPGELPVYLGDWNEEYAYDHPMVENDAPRIVGSAPPDRDGVSQPERVVIGIGSER